MFSVSVVAGVAVAAVLTLACFVFDDTIAGLFDADRENILLFEATKDYLLGLCLGSIPLTLNPLLRTVITINGDKIRVELTTLVVTAINCILNALVMLVWDMGMFGVGLATSIAQWIGLLIYLLHFVKGKIMCKFSFQGIQLSALREVLARGFSRATLRICNTLRPLLINSWILTLSTSAAVSAVGVNNNIRDLILIPVTAISLTVVLLAGIFYTEQDKTSLYQLMRIAFVNCLRIVLPVVAGMLLFAPWLASVYLQKGTQAHAMACVCLRWTAVGMLFYVGNDFFLAFLQATDRHRRVHLFVILEKLVYVVLWAYILGFLFGIRGVFASFAVSEMCCSLHILLMTWIRQRKFPRKLQHIMMLPQEFEIDSENSLELSISCMEEVTGVSEKVMDFCLEKGVDHRRAYSASLCTEELAVNIVKHGFVPGKAQNLQIRVLYVQDDVILRFRDSCKLFDIREHYRLADEDVSKNIGIRLVMNMSKDVMYVNSLNLNTTIIKI